MGDRLKVGLIGLGRFGALHLGAWSAVGAAEVVAVSSRSAERAREVADRWAVPRTYTDWHDLVGDPEVQAVDVVTDWARHARPTVAALGAGKHVLVEKPMATTLADAERMLGAWRGSGRVLMVGHLLRFDPAYVQLAERVHRGRLGRVVTLFCRRNVTRSHFARHARCTPVLETGIHDIDLCRWLLREEVTRVRAWKSHTLDKQIADTYWLWLEFAGGALAVVETSWLLPEGGRSALVGEVEVLGTEGVARIELPGWGLEVWGAAGTQTPDLAAWPQVEGLVTGMLRQELSYFTQCILEGREPDRLHPEDARAALAVALAGIESAERGEPVTLPTADLARDPTSPTAP